MQYSFAKADQVPKGNYTSLDFPPRYAMVHHLNMATTSERTKYNFVPNTIKGS